MMKIEGSGPIFCQRDGSADPDPDPDPHQNVMDPQHRKTHNLDNFNFVIREYDEQREAILDGSCTDNTTSVCKPALLHAR
jgi:hypothetical protein